MTRNVILLVDADADTVSVVGSAAALLNLDVRFARTSRELFQLIPNGLEEVAVILLDVDPGVHAVAVLEALDVWSPAPPVIVISSLEEAHLRPVAIAHGAAECLGKPVSVQRMKRAIVQFARASEAQGCRCDVWGHPCAGGARHGAEPNEREVALFAEQY